MCFSLVFQIATTFNYTFIESFEYPVGVFLVSDNSYRLINNTSILETMRLSKYLVLLLKHEGYFAIRSK